LAKAASKKPEPEPKVDNPEAVARLTRYSDELRKIRDARAPKDKGTTKRTPELERLFLEGLADGHSITTSAWAINIHRTTAFDWRVKSEATKQEDGTYTDDFCVRWDQAVQAGTDRLEDEAIRRAARGYERPVFQGGVMVGTTTEYSDTLMALVLKGKRPEKYNTERHEMSGPNGGAIPVAMEIEFVDVKAKK
jgi:hypothetical protein